MNGAATDDGKTGNTPPLPFTILIADDSESIQALFSLYLKGEDYRLIFAKNGREVVEAFKAAEFDLVLMDILMPLMDGLDATREIRAHEQANNIQPTPIVAMSANSSSEDKECSARAGCTYFLDKPISKSGLLEFINHILKDG